MKCLEKILKSETAKKIIKKIVKGVAGIVLPVCLLSQIGCAKNNPFDPLGAKIEADTSQTEGYVFSGDNLSASITPKEQPYKSVTVQVQRPNGDYSTAETLTTSNGTFSKAITTNTYGTHRFKFRVISDRNGTSNEKIVESTVYMNEAQSDAALEQAINEIGVDPATTTKGEIKLYTINGTTGAYQFDGDDMEIRCRGPPFFSGYYFIDVQGSKTDTFNQAKKDYINSLSEGYVFISPVTSKNEIKNRILQEKNTTDPHNWPQISGY